MSLSNGLSGPGNDFKHQALVSLLIYEFMKKFELKAYKNHIALPELSLQPLSGKIPDVTICKLSRKQLKQLVLIEVCTSRTFNDDVKKVTGLMVDISSLNECFVINKDDDSVYRIFRKKDGKPSKIRQHDRCETFKLNLSKIIEILPV